MAIESIKITDLTNIGSNISYTSILPIVDISGDAITDKANVQIIGNVILQGAGGSHFPAASQAILAQTVTNAAQPNITSVGILSNITVSGNANLGYIDNVTILGGTNGQYIQTDGTGNLTFVTGGGSGNGVVGGSNTQIQFNNAGSFGGSPYFIFDVGNLILSTPTLSAINATIYDVGAITTVVSQDITTNNITAATFLGNNTRILGNTSVSVNGSATTTVWTASNVNVEAAKLTLRVQHGDPTIGVELTDIRIAKENSSSNVVVSEFNNIRTNSAISYVTITVGVDGNSHLIVRAASTANVLHFYTHEATEFTRSVP